jgi:23S rRNA (guanosine2251-2'-O)-methyltransferase
VTVNQDVLAGFHSVQTLLKTAPDRAIELLVVEQRRDQRLQKTVQLARRLNIPVRNSSAEELLNLVSGEKHQGVVLIAKAGETFDEKWLQSQLSVWDKPLLLVLDEVTDPHNLGACLRSADAAGVNAVIVPRDHSCGLTPVVRKVASGAAETVPLVMVTNLARTLKELQDANVWLTGAAGEAEQTLYELDLRGPVAIVMGAEGSGMRRLTRESCDYLAKIPMAGAVESLNVSVATGIMLFEAVRQRET